MNFSKQLTTSTLRSTGVTYRKMASNMVNQRCMSAYSHMSDNDPKVLEKEKEKHLKSKNKEWNEKLASASEASVKADKEADIPIKDLQDKSVKDQEKNRDEE
ncbi:hypothetical protein G6F56_011494 [Rhizopus delemar]|nr:hypothetical protein G6F56_011494 [Rhizopus delemar]